MTEYITKDQAEALAAEVNLKWTSYDEFVEDLRRAINLAFEQRLEVVGYKNYFSGTVTTSLPAWAHSDESITVYALKGDSK
jgi:hypothetical protein